MFEIDTKYLKDKPFKPTDFVGKDLTRADKKRLKEVIKSGTLKYQISGEDIPSLIDESYNYQVIMFFDLELTNIKSATFVNNILQKSVIKAPCIFKFHDHAYYCYAFADKRLSMQEEGQIVVDNTVVTAPQPNNAKFDERLSYKNIKNRNNKRFFYTELMIKAYLLDNIKLVSNLMSIFDIPIWYDEHKKMSFYTKLKELQQLQKEQAKVTMAKDKVELNSKMKELITKIMEYYAN